ncbi:MAG: NAD(P)-dependent alcohol dehydrogenase [Burkholderiales bacterium]|nr:NAD(P)-dependent alcohol dehydrogenase [Burkholderiales bacterium]
MQAYHLERSDGPINQLVLREHAIPTLEPRQVLVRIRATSLNRRDLMILNNTYPVPTAKDVIPLCDGAGEVVAIGPAVTRASIGDRVTASYFAHWVEGRRTRSATFAQYGVSLNGMLAEYAVIEEDSLVHVPAYLAWEEAATLACAGVTAWSALNGARPVLAGETVLTLGSGGVALFALQFAKAMGARVITVTSSASKAPFLRSLGADEVIDAHTYPSWDETVRDLTDGQGVDHVVEAVGPDTLERSIRATGFDAQIALVGVFAEQEKYLNLSALQGKILNLRRIAVGSRSDFEAMNQFMATHALRPVIEQRFNFADAPAAYQHFATTRNLGKTVITLP